MEPAGTSYGFTVSRKISVRSARHPSSSLRIFWHSPSPPVGTAPHEDRWKQVPVVNSFLGGEEGLVVGLVPAGDTHESPSVKGCGDVPVGREAVDEEAGRRAVVPILGKSS